MSGKSSKKICDLKMPLIEEGEELETTGNWSPLHQEGSAWKYHKHSFDELSRRARLPFEKSRTQVCLPKLFFAHVYSKRVPCTSYHFVLSFIIRISLYS